MRRDVFEQVRMMVGVGQLVKAKVTKDAGDTPYEKGDVFVVGDLKIANVPDGQEIQVKSEDGWAFLADEVEFLV